VATRDKDVPTYSYVVAVVAGMCYTWGSFLTATVVTQLFDGRERGLSFLGAVTFAAAHVVIGGVFGLLWPEKTWRWGVWLCLVPVCLGSLFETYVSAFFWFLALTLAPACTGAYAAARVHLKYVEAE
jgi:MFS family permease